ncbi:MAG TPA: thiamine pyrophosphate-dependent dehydrogenase E1 component subunit alpha [Roseiflexaceae bacterium]|nr:thiamine pyrophosphate-dependent dehydrogenase E1 component subunit alpha [Roseiflexaceae bacterium]
MTTVSVQQTLLDLPAGLDEAAVLEMYRYMLLARAIDERMWQLNRTGRAPFAIPAQGHEAAGVGAAFALRPGTDIVLPYYRDMVVCLVLGMTARDMLLGVLARADDPNSGGRQMPCHFSSRKHRIITQSSVVATQVPHAAGAALAEKIKGGDAVVWCSFGEGSTSQGDWHEGVNLAAVHRLPVIFHCENNEYAISVPASLQMAVPSVAARAAAYGIPGVSVDGLDPLAVYAATREAIARARAGQGPTLIEARCIRLTPHTSDDNDRTYRAREEIAALRERDPLPRFREQLCAAGILDEAHDRALRAQVAREVDEATAFAEQAPPPAPEDLLKHVYAA